MVRVKNELHYDKHGNGNMFRNAAISPQPPATGLKLFNDTITNPKTQAYLDQVLGEKRASFVNNLTALVANAPNLQQCKPTSVMYAAIKATALDLPLDQNLGFAYVIPYGNAKQGATEAQFQLGWRGLAQLSIRSGQFKTINVTEVREGEVGLYDLLTGAMSFNVKPNRHTLPVVGYVAYFELLNGFNKSLYMTKEEVELHAKTYSQTYKRGYGVWKDNFDAMARKTVLKLLLGRFAPMSVQMQEAVRSDQAIIDEHQKAKHIDNKVKAPTAEDVAFEEVQHKAPESDPTEGTVAPDIGEGTSDQEAIPPEPAFSSAPQDEAEDMFAEE